MAMQQARQVEQESTLEDETFGPMPLAKLEVRVLNHKLVSLYISVVEQLVDNN